MAKLTRRKKRRERAARLTDSEANGKNITTDIKSTVLREHFQTLYSIKLENLKEMDEFLDSAKSPKLNREDTSTLKNSNEELVIVIKSRARWIHRILSPIQRSTANPPQSIETERRAGERFQTLRKTALLWYQNQVKTTTTKKKITGQYLWT